MAKPYEKVTIDGTFFKMIGWYLFNIPIKVPYSSLAYEAQKHGYKLKKLPEDCEIIESPKKFGKGWVAVEIHPTRKIDDSVIILNQ